MRRPLNGTPQVTQPFGANDVDYSQFGLKGHHGTDYGVGIGTPVYAAESGVAEFSQNGVTDKYTGRFAAGETIVINGSYECWYMHLSQRLVTRGQNVAEGQLIGYSGDTGFVTGPHLHFGIRPLNPDINNGYRGFIDFATVLFAQPTQQAPQGGDDMIKAEDRALVERLTRRLKLWGGSFDMNREMTAWTNQDWRRFLTEGMDESEARFNELQSQASRAVSLESTLYSRDAQIADLKEKLAAAEAKAQEVKIIEKPVEVIKEVPVYTHDKQTSEDVSTIKKMITAIYNYFKGQFKTFKKYDK